MRHPPWCAVMQGDSFERRDRKVRARASYRRRGIYTFSGAHMYISVGKWRFLQGAPDGFALSLRSARHIKLVVFAPKRNTVGVTRTGTQMGHTGGGAPMGHRRTQMDATDTQKGRRGARRGKREKKNARTAVKQYVMIALTDISTNATAPKQRNAACTFQG